MGHDETNKKYNILISGFQPFIFCVSCPYVQSVSHEDLNYQSEMIIFESLLTTFEASLIFLRQLRQYDKLVEPKTQPP